MRGAPLEYDAQRRSFYYSTPSWRLPALDLTEGELLQLAVVQSMAGQYQGTPLGSVLDDLFAKIRAALPERIKIDPLLVDREFSLATLATVMPLARSFTLLRAPN